MYRASAISCHVTVVFRAVQECQVQLLQRVSARGQVVLGLGCIVFVFLPVNSDLLV